MGVSSDHPPFLCFVGLRANMKCRNGGHGNTREGCYNLCDRRTTIARSCTLGPLVSGDRSQTKRHTNAVMLACQVMFGSSLSMFFVSRAIYVPFVCLPLPRSRNGSRRDHRCQPPNLTTHHRYPQSPTRPPMAGIRVPRSLTNGSPAVRLHWFITMDVIRQSKPVIIDKRQVIILMSRPSNCGYRQQPR